MTVTAKILCDSIFKGGSRLTSYELRYPRFIHSEVMTHCVFARNASSSRAIPISKVIDSIKQDCAMPERWGLAGKGMQDHGEMTPEGIAEMKKLWLEARDHAIDVVSRMLIKKEKPHKQIANRLLEPFSHITVVLTSDKFNNFFAQRKHEDADPTIQKLANAMWDARETSTPRILEEGDWHLPYINEFEWAHLATITEPIRHQFELKKMVMVSVARCARTSYKTHDGRIPSFEEDLDLYEKLVGYTPMHASPAEHQATPDTFSLRHNPKKGKPEKAWDNPELHSKYTGWIMYRQTLDGHFVKG